MLPECTPSSVVLSCGCLTFRVSSARPNGPFFPVSSCGVLILLSFGASFSIFAEKYLPWRCTQSCLSQGFWRLSVLGRSSSFPRVAPWALVQFTGLFRSLLGVVEVGKHRLLLDSCVVTHSLGFAYSSSAIQPFGPYSPWQSCTFSTLLAPGSSNRLFSCFTSFLTIPLPVFLI